MAAMVVFVTAGASADDPAVPPHAGPPLVLIAPVHDRVQLTDVYPAARPGNADRFHGPSNGSFSVLVESRMPTWGIIATAQPLRGTDQDLDRSRLWVRSSQSADTFASLRDGVPLLSDHGFSSRYEADIDVAVRPSWSDPAGSYTGELMLSPVLTGGDNEQIVTAGQPQTIEFGFDIPEVIEFHLSGSRITFSKIEGPGLYTADEGLIVSVATNSRAWRIVADGTDLMTETGAAIESGRICWKLHAPASTDDEIASGILGKRVVFYEGSAPTESMEMRLTFEVDVQMRDHAGDYAADLRMTGEVIPPTEMDHY